MKKNNNKIVFYALGLTLLIFSLSTFAFSPIRFIKKTDPNPVCHPVHRTNAFLGKQSLVELTIYIGLEKNGSCEHLHTFQRYTDALPPGQYYIPVYREGLEEAIGELHEGICFIEQYKILPNGSTTTLNYVLIKDAIHGFIGKPFEATIFLN